MAQQELMCLLWNGASSSSARRWAVKAVSVAHQVGKSPIQIAITSNDPQLIDLNMVRPTMTLSLILDKKITGQVITGPSKGGGTNYKVPTKQDIEDFVTGSFYSASTALTVMFLHEDNNYESYEFAVQQFTANLIPAKEDRYDCTMVILTRKRGGDYDQVTTW